MSCGETISQWIAMRRTSWIRLARTQSHWALFFLQSCPNQIPPIDYWLHQKSVDPKLKAFLKNFRSEVGLLQLIGGVGVSVEEVATIIVFCNLENGWFDKTIGSFNQNPPPFPYTKDVNKLKLAHSVWNLLSIVFNKSPQTPKSRAISITKRIMRLAGQNITNQYLVRIANESRLLGKRRQMPRL